MGLYTTIKDESFWSFLFIPIFSNLWVETHLGSMVKDFHFKILGWVPGVFLCSPLPPQEILMWVVHNQTLTNAELQKGCAFDLSEKKYLAY